MNLEKGIFMSSIEQRLQQMACEYLKNTVTPETLLEIGKNLNIDIHQEDHRDYANLVVQISNTLFNLRPLSA